MAPTTTPTMAANKAHQPRPSAKLCKVDVPGRSEALGLNGGVLTATKVMNKGTACAPPGWTGLVRACGLRRQPIVLINLSAFLLGFTIFYVYLRYRLALTERLSDLI